MNSIKKSIPVFAVAAIALALCIAVVPMDESEATTIGDVTYNSYNGLMIEFTDYSEDIGKSVDVMGNGNGNNVAFVGTIGADGVAVCEGSELTSGEYHIQILIGMMPPSLKAELTVIEVTLDPDGGNGQAETVYVSAPGHIDLPTMEWTKGDEKFLGWSTSSGSDTPDVDFESGLDVDAGVTSVTLYAVYGPGEEPVPENFTVSFEQPANGSLTITYDGKEIQNGAEVPKDANIVIIAAACEGYELESLMVNGSDFQSGDAYTVNADVYIVAVFKETSIEPDEVTVTFYPNGGTGSMEPQTVIVNEATALDENTFANEGWTFTGWNTQADGSGKSYADGAEVILTDNLVLYAQWTPVEWTVTVSAGEGGYANPSGEQTVVDGADLTVTFIPGKGYEVFEVLIDGNSVQFKANDDGTVDIVLEDVGANMSVSATFEKMTFEVIIDPDITGGSVTADPTTVEYGGSVTLTATADGDMRLASMTVNNQTYYQTSVTIDNVTEDVNVTAVFESTVGPEPERHDITLNYDNDMGTVNGPSGVDAVVDGADARYTITANDGYVIVSYAIDDGDPVLLNRAISGSFVLENVTADHIITVVFAEAVSYTVTVSADIQNGAVTPMQTTVYEGRSVTLIVTPDRSYELGNLMVNGEDVTGMVSNGRIVIDDVREDISVTAEFVKSTTPVPDDDDEEYVPPVVVVRPDSGDDDTTTYIVAIAAAAVVAILAALILMQTRKS